MTTESWHFAVLSNLLALCSQREHRWNGEQVKKPAPFLKIKTLMEWDILRFKINKYPEVESVRMATTPNQTLFPASHSHPFLTNPHPWLRECEPSTVVTQIKIMSTRLTMNYQRNFIWWNMTYLQNLRHRFSEMQWETLVGDIAPFILAVLFVKVQNWLKYRAKEEKGLSFILILVYWIVGFFLSPIAL